MSTMSISDVARLLDAGFSPDEVRAYAKAGGDAGVTAEAPVREAKSPKVNRFYAEVIAARVPCAMGPKGQPVKGCARHFAPNGSGATNHLRHGSR